MDHLRANPSRLFPLRAGMHQRAVQKSLARPKEDKVEEEKDETVRPRVHVHPSPAEHLRRLLQSPGWFHQSRKDPSTPPRVWSRADSLRTSICTVRWAHNTACNRLQRLLPAEKLFAGCESRRFVLVGRKALPPGAFNPGDGVELGSWGLFNNSGLLVGFDLISKILNRKSIKINWNF